MKLAYAAPFLIIALAPTAYAGAAAYGIVSFALVF